ncbi:MAG: ATP synthase F1 subunit gamma [Candidatus Kerfeldbacteria bacterium]|nr:ATP synthase F1 subunit gamma [Candidatus Kerfeldbacteria bacterium]
MAESTRTIRRRLKSIASTRKITRAMELVSAAKMRRASEAALATRPYALSAWSLLEHLTATTERKLHPLLAHREVRKTAVVFLTTNRGLVGGLNAQLVRAVTRLADEGEVVYVTVGKRGQDALRRLGKPIVATFTDLPDRPTLASMVPVARLTIDEFRSGAVDRVLVVYPDFVSTLLQVPRVKQLLPLDPDSIRRFLNETGGARERLTVQPEQLREFTFEPSPDALLEAMLPRLVESQLYQAFLETSASEHAARMVAMRNATDAAGELSDALTLMLNQTRQAAITKDLTEISASRAALEA